MCSTHVPFSISAKIVFQPFTSFFYASLITSISHRANMTLFEYDTLCRAYIEISINSVNGANQTAERL